MKRIADFTVFVAVVKAGTISDATSALGLSVASISKYLMRAEQSVGVRLLLRSSHGLKLTEEGQALYDHLETLFAQVETAISQTGASRTEPRGSLHVSATAGLGRRCIAPLVSRFATQYPALSVRLSLADHKLDMFRDQVDLAITAGQPEDSSLIARKLLDNPSLLCASPDYLERWGSPEGLADLPRHQCLVWNCHGACAELWSLTDSKGRHHNLQVEGHLTTDNSETLREWLLEGYGIALKSRWDIEDDLKHGRLVQVLPEYRGPDLDFHLVYPSRDFMPAKTRTFIEFVRRNINQLKSHAAPEAAP